MNKIALITDLHIGKDGKAFEVSTYENFKALLEEMRKWPLDHLIVAGDLCFREPQEEVYTLIKSDLDQYGIPYSIIVGNHDDGKCLAQQFEYLTNFDEENEELYYTKPIGERLFIFLDTKQGNISKTQLEWLMFKLKENSSKKPIIIMHYPPVFGGVPHMDNSYALENQNAFLEPLFKLNQSINIFCGHYHVEKTIQMGLINVFITPSAFVQIDQQKAEFKADHHKIAYRIIDFDLENLWTSVHYLHDYK